MPSLTLVSFPLCAGRKLPTALDDSDTLDWFCELGSGRPRTTIFRFQRRIERLPTPARRHQSPPTILLCSNLRAWARGRAAAPSFLSYGCSQCMDTSHLLSWPFLQHKRMDQHFQPSLLRRREEPSAYSWRWPVRDFRQVHVRVGSVEFKADSNWTKTKHVNLLLGSHVH